MPPNARQLHGLIWIGVALLAWAAPASGLYAKDGPLVQLDARNFDRLVTHSDGVAVVEFFAPWCGHCKALAPAYQKVAENLKGIVLVGAVDCDKAKNQALCGKYEVQGFPTIKIFPSDKQKDRKTGQITKTPTDYTGPRTAKGISSAATARLVATHITRVSDATEFQSFLDQNNGSRVVLFTNKREPSTLYKGLSLQYVGRLAFAEVDSVASDVANEFDVKDLPTLIVIQVDGNYVKYDGEIKAPALMGFLDVYASKVKTPTEPAGGLDGGTPEYKVLSFQDLKDINAQEDLWLIGFVRSAPGNMCRPELVEFDKATLGLKEMVQVGLVNLTKDEANNAGVYQVKPEAFEKAPCGVQVVRFPFGEDKGDDGDHELYTGAIDAKPLQDFALHGIPPFAIAVDGQTLDPFLGTVPGGNNPLAPKVLLFSTKEDNPAVYSALAMNFRKWRIAFGWVPKSEAVIRERFQVEKPPAMLLFYVEPGAEVDDSGRAEMKVQPYGGPMKYRYMREFVHAVGSALGANPEGSDEASAGGPPPEVANDADFKAACGDRIGLCVIGVLDRGAPSFGDDLQTLTRVSAGHAGQPLWFMWLHGPSRPAFREALGLLTGDTPTVAVLSAQKLRFATLREAYTAEHVGSFLGGLLRGSIGTAPMQALPSIEESVDSDEGLGTDDALEDEMDLADIMSEDIDVGGMGTREDLLKDIERQIQEEMESARAEREGAKGKKKKRRGKKGGAKEEL